MVLEFQLIETAVYYNWYCNLINMTYTSILSTQRCIDPWNNREVWVDNIVCHHAFSSPIVRIAKIHAYLLRAVRGTYAAIAEHVLYLAFLNITSLLPAIHMVIYGRAVFR